MTFRFGGNTDTSTTNRIVSTVLAAAILLTSLIFYTNSLRTPAGAVDESGFALVSDYIVGSVSAEPTGPTLSSTGSAVIGLDYDTTTQTYMLGDEDDFLALAAYSYTNSTAGMAFTISSEVPVTLTDAFSGIGSITYPFAGTIVSVYPTTITLSGSTALFRYLSSTATLFETDNTVTIAADSSCGGLAQVLVANSASMALSDKIVISGTVLNQIPSSAATGELSNAAMLFGSIVMGAGVTSFSFSSISNAALSLTGTSVTAAGTGDAGLLVGRVYGDVTFDLTPFTLTPLSCAVTSNRSDAGALFGSCDGALELLCTSPLTCELTGAVTATRGDAGFIIGSISAAASLTVTDKTTSAVADISLTTTGGSVNAYRYRSGTTDLGGSAGSLTGSLSAGGEFIAGDVSLNTIVINAGRGAGGAVGTLTDATVTCDTISVASGAVGGASYCGGYIGLYDSENTVQTAITLADETVTIGSTSALVISPAYSTINGDIGLSDTFSTGAGGLFGRFIANDDTPTYSIEYSTLNSEQINVSFTTTMLNQYSYCLGGLIGIYTADDIMNTLAITGYASATIAFVKSVLTSPANQRVYSYGGVIGIIGENAYVSFDNVAEGTAVGVGSATYSLYFGGFVGYALDGALLESNNSRVYSGFFSYTSGAALSAFVGALGEGTVLHLRGTFIITNNTYTFTTNVYSGSNFGQIVGRQDNSLVFCDADWDITRASNSNGYFIDDIGNYGAVIKNGALGNFISITAARTVAFASTLAGGGATVSIGSLQNFAALAITVSTRGVFSAVSGITDYTELLSKTIELTASVDLSGTGIESITRSDSTTDAFTGTFDGNGNTLTLATGERYNPAASNTGAGGIVDHRYVGLFCAANGATFTDLTLDGVITCETSGNPGPINDANVYAGGLAGYASGTISVTNVTTEITVREKKTAYVNNNSGVNCYYGGMFGYYTGSNLSITSSTGTAEFFVSVYDYSYTGGYVGSIVTVGGGVLDFSDATLTAKITATGSHNSIHAGGLVSNIYTGVNSFNASNIASVDLTGLTVNAASTITENAVYSAGGLLGYEWKYVEVELSGSVNGTVDVTGGANFGGMIHLLSGKMTLDAATTIQGTFTGSSTRQDISDGAVVCQGKNLYLVVKNGASVTPTITNGTTNRTDLLVGTNVATFDTGAPERGGIVTIETGSAIPGDMPATSSWYSVMKNPNARYYFNVECLDKDHGAAYLARVLTNRQLSNAGDLILWGILNYTSVSDSAAPAYYFRIRNGFATNRSYSLTQDIDASGLCVYPTTVTGGTYNFANHTLTFDSTPLVNVAITNPLSQEYMMQTGMFFNIEGSLTVNNAVLSGTVSRWANGSGALVTGRVSGSYTDEYTYTIIDFNINGLEMNNLLVADAGTIGYSPLLINKIHQCVDGDIENITEDYGNTAAGVKAGSNLIGDTGDEDATFLNIFFKSIIIDGDEDTTRLTRSSLFNSVTYLAGHSSFIYNFYIDEDWPSTSSHIQQVTYGEELTSNNTEYYDAGLTLKVNCDNYPTNTVRNYSDYIPYVFSGTEVDVNKKSGDLIEGWGTYQHPYIIDSPRQFFAVFQFISDPTKVQDGWQVNYPDGADDTARHISTTYQTLVKGTAGFDNATVRAWLQQAYYQLDADIDLSSETSYFGFGTEDYPFYGVIIGKKDSRQHTVTMPTAANIGVTNIGSLGLVNVGYGCVVKDVTIEYSGTYTVSSIASSYFGGVIGEVVGGDNIIDGVSVTGINTAGNGIKLTNRITYAGGYVGFVKAGGVVFRNMSDAEGIMLYGSDGAAVGNDYFYANPYVGCTIDGYAITELASGESYSIANTDKNYTVNSISGTVTSNELIDVSLASSKYTVSIADARELFIFAAALNSGSLSVGTDTAYTASRIRVSGYSTVGSLTTTADYTRALIDNAAITSSSKPYLVYKYFSAGMVATSKSTISLAENTYDMTSYGNGFHGLGGRYTDTTARETPTLRPTDNGTTAAINGNGSTVILNMNVDQYLTDSGTNITVETYSANHVGFVNQFRNSGLSTIKDITIQGRSTLTFYNATSSGNEYTTVIDGYNAGGLIGFSTSASSGNVVLTDVVASDLTVSSVGRAGTMIASSQEAVTLTDCYYTGCTVKGKVTVGGLIGYANSVTSILSTSDITNADSVIINDSASIVRADGLGGLVGLNNNTLTIGQVGASIAMSNVMVVQRYYTGTNITRFGAGGVIGTMQKATTITNVDITDIYVLASQTTESNLNKQTGLDYYKNYYGITNAKFGDYADLFAAFLKWELYYRNRSGHDDIFSANDYLAGGSGAVVGAGTDTAGTNYSLALNDVHVSASAGGGAVILSGNNSGGLIGDYRSTSTALNITDCSFNATGTAGTAAGRGLVIGGARAAGVAAYVPSRSVNLTRVNVGNDANRTQFAACSQNTANSNATAGLLSYINMVSTVDTCVVKNCVMSSCVVGGMVAYVAAGNVTVKNSSLEDCDLRCVTFGGGAVAQTVSITYLSNFTMSNCNIVGERINGTNSAYAGGLIGSTNKNVFGNSILSDNCEFGYSTTNYSGSGNINRGIDGTAFTLTNHTRVGAWLGVVTSAVNLRLLAVTRNDALEVEYPCRATGTPASSSVVYADSGATDATTIKTLPTVTPSTGVTFTGDAIEYGKAAALRSDISWWHNTSAATTATDDYFKQYSEYDATTVNPALEDMQLYFLDTDVDTSMKNYINLLTNGGFSDWAANGLTLSVTSNTYNVANNTVTKVTTNGVSGSVVYDSATGVFSNGTQYDNLTDGGGTFTVLTLRFTNGSNTADTTPFTMHVTIYYPQVLEVQTRIIPIEYEEYALPVFLAQTEDSINISLGGTFAVYMEYIYNEVRLVDVGWNFDKLLSSKSDTGLDTGAIDNFPAGSIIKLIDLNSPDSSGYKTYFYTLPATTRTISLETIQRAEGVTTGLTPLASLPSLNDYTHTPAVGVTDPEAYGLERYVIVVELPQPAAGSEQEKMIYHLYPDLVRSHNVTVQYSVPQTEARVSVWPEAVIDATLHADDSHADINQLKNVEAKFGVDINFTAGYISSMAISNKVRYGVMQLHMKDESGSSVLLPAGTVITITDSAGNIVMDTMLQQSVYSTSYNVDGNLLDPTMVYPLEYDISLDFSSVDPDLFYANFTDIRYTLYNDFYMTPNANYPQSGIGGTSSITLSHTAENLAGIVVNANENMLDLGINNYETETAENDGIIDFNIFVDIEHCSQTQLETMRLAGSTTKITFTLYKKGLNDVYSAVTASDYINYITQNGTNITNLTYPMTIGNETEISIPFTVSFKTGAITDYANFKLMATLSSVDSTANEIIAPSHDHFCCTLAKIYTKIE